MRALGVVAAGLVALAGPPRADAGEAVAAAFSKRSYAPATNARLRIWTDSPLVEVQLFRAGPERARTWRNDVMNGVAVAPPQRFRLRARSTGPHTVKLRIYFWPSGVYFARLRTAAGAVSFAPFVLRPALIGGTRVSVVIPTNMAGVQLPRRRRRRGWRHLVCVARDLLSRPDASVPRSRRAAQVPRL